MRGFIPEWAGRAIVKKVLTKTTSWIRVFLEKAIGAQLMKKSPAFNGT
jgi:hypothetical protein